MSDKYFYFQLLGVSNFELGPSTRSGAAASSTGSSSATARLHPSAAQPALHLDGLRTAPAVARSHSGAEHTAGLTQDVSKTRGNLIDKPDMLFKLDKLLQAS